MYITYAHTLLLILKKEHKDGADKRLRHEIDLMKVIILDANDVFRLGFLCNRWINQSIDRSIVLYQVLH